MFEIFETIGIAWVMFAATNADDLVLLTIFFAQPNCAPGQIVFGQLAGIGALTAVSYTASALALAVPHGWLPWLGVVPVLIGLSWLRRSGHNDNDAPPAATMWWAIAGVTIANGADNLGVYIPEFAMQTGAQKVITGSVFLFLTFVWCAIAWAAMRHPTWGPFFSGVCRRIAPWVLIGLGLWIIAHHSVFDLGLSRT